MESMKDKHGFNYMKDWMEIWMYPLFIIGIYTSATAENKLVLYAIAVVFGIGWGRFFFIKRFKYQFPFYVLAGTFFVGFVIATVLTKKASPYIVSLVLIFSSMAGYKIFEKGYFRE